MDHLIRIKLEDKILDGILNIPKQPRGLVIFSHGSGSGRNSPRNQLVADYLQKRGFATFLVDLLTQQEDEIYQNRFDTDLLSKRLIGIIDFFRKHSATKELPIGLFGASTGAASALIAASKMKNIKAIVSRGGRPDLAIESLCYIECPILLIVGEKDGIVLDLNMQAFEKISSEKKLSTINNATHLFEEPGCLEEVSKLAADWFMRHLKI